MKISAATLIKKNFIKVLDLNLPKIQKGQVLVKIKYSSICHTQIQEIMGLRGKDRYLPHCLGHEATGLVEEIGPEVKKVKKNDKVCLTWLQSGGKRAGGVKYLHKKKIINAGPVNTFSNYAIISEDRILKLPKKNNLKRDVLMGCAIPTAFNAVFNTLKGTTKDNIIIFGTGGVGLACIFAAKKVGFKKIFALDRVYKKLKVVFVNFPTITLTNVKKCFEIAPSPYVIQVQVNEKEWIIINNHLKCCGDGTIDSDTWDEEYRRQQASILLESYIKENWSTEPVILIGDYNDEIQEPESNNIFWNFILINKIS